MHDMLGLESSLRDVFDDADDVSISRARWAAYEERVQMELGESDGEWRTFGGGGSGSGERRRKTRGSSSLGI